MIIKNIKLAVEMNQVIVSRHAKEEAEADNLTLEEILNSVTKGEIIENYDDDKPYPSCLIYGDNQKQEPIHSVWAYNEDTGYAVLITVYRPSPEKWINCRTRRKTN
ncbi:DUF4258 domain-containing protein [Crocosphaera sp. XPORK-15E]|uniref:DUF4258 domain-containing protein n=1 Tax=Crocosphaera sp. XPORK-15E TaxID=3110247 RepID=UPI002B217DD4|nr:DUF4258 domain-containing protein [Crocosphaera sp. XPORK-15E]MEA5535085.1 DUF4258 domain-containing protein [Crocosphaera sp. XPORK-15E]